MCETVDPHLSESRVPSAHHQNAAQLAQWGATRTRWALANPNPPAESARLDTTCEDVGALGVPEMVRKQFHTLASWRAANASVNSGRMARNQNLARVEAHMIKRSRAA